MAEYSDLIAAIGRRADLDTDQVKAALDAVVATLAHSLPPRTRDRVAAALPDVVEEAALVPGRIEIRTGTSLVIEIAQRLDTTAERARYLAQAVLDGLADTVPEVIGLLRDDLASDLLAVLDRTGTPPGGAASTRAH